MAKRQAALDMPSGAGWRMLASMLHELSPLAHMPAAMRLAGGKLYQEADAIACEREGEEKQRMDIRDARRRTREELKRFNQGRRHYRGLVKSGVWAGEPWEGGVMSGERMNNRARVRVLDSILSHMPAATPWGTERGFELRPDLAARAAAIAARAEAIADELRPMRSAMLESWEREEEERRERERQERERVRSMSPDEKRTAWEAGEIGREYIAEIEREHGPLLRAIAPEIDGCRVTGGTLETSQGATVPLRHAFRVFQFIALCRAQGRNWLPGRWGPAHIRVGHFHIDSVDTSGNFKAGCHSIQWAEVERLASRLGVADCLASLPELETELAGEPA